MRKGGTLAGTWPVLGAGEPGGSAAPASSEARSRGEHVDMGLAGDSDRLPVRVDTPRSPEAAEAAPSPAGPSPRSPAPPPGPAARCGWLLLPQHGGSKAGGLEPQTSQASALVAPPPLCQLTAQKTEPEAPETRGFPGTQLRCLWEKCEKCFGFSTETREIMNGLHRSGWDTRGRCQGPSAHL